MLNGCATAEIKKSYTLTNKKKKMIFAKIIDKKEEIFNVNYLNDAIKKISSLDEIDISKLLNLKPNIYTKCLFLENHFAWISSNKFGKQRYFTKGHLTYFLDISDLLTIYFNCNYNQLSTYLVEIGYQGADWKSVEVKKYKKNIEDIFNILRKNDNIKKSMLEKIDIYMALNDFGAKNTLAFDRDNTNSIFFVSTRHLKEQYNLKYSISTINQVINYYSLLGLINKISNKDIKSPIYYSYRVKKTKLANISFYSIPSIESILEKVRVNDSILTENKINYYDITKFTSLNLHKTKGLPKVVYNPNLGGGDKQKKAKELVIDKDYIEYYFNYYLREYDVVAKEWIKEHKEIKMSNTAFDRVWNEIIRHRRGRSIKPTKRMKMKYDLKTNQDVYINPKQ